AVMDLATLNASGDITLGDNTTDTTNFGRLNVTGVNVTITEDSATVFTGVNTVTKDLTQNSAGTITDSPSTTFVVGDHATFNAPLFDIILGDNAGDTTNFGSLNANGSNITVTGDSAMSVGLVNAIGQVNLTVNGSITEETPEDLAADIIGSTINLVVLGTASTVGIAGGTLEIDATILNIKTAGGSIFMEDTAGGVAIGLVTATPGNLALTAPAGDVTLTATNGSITQVLPVNGHTPNIVGSTVNLTITGRLSTIGTKTDRLEVVADNLNKTSGSIGIHIHCHDALCQQTQAIVIGDRMKLVDLDKWPQDVMRVNNLFFERVPKNVNLAFLKMDNSGVGPGGVNESKLFRCLAAEVEMTRDCSISAIGEKESAVPTSTSAPIKYQDIDEF
ncbi:MAG: hypothetical protein AAB300_04100, partial [Nitrospirota bacterium]